MDIYTPDGDNCINRPLIILAHGGSFIGGSKTNPTMVDLCETFAKRGYVAASINYRLATSSTVLGPFSGLFWMTNLEDGIKVIYSAMTDAKAAVRFFRKNVTEDNNSYGIDQDQIWMGGNSAGACLGPHMSYINSVDEFVSGIDISGQEYALNLASDNGGIEGNSGNSGYSSDISGMINLAGALHTVDWIDELDDTPIVSCHGTEDETVPDECGTILNSPTNLTACGSMAIHPVISNYDVVNDLLIYDGEAHCPWDGNALYKQQMIDFVTSFVYNNIQCDQTYIEEIYSDKTLLYSFDLLGRISSSNDGLKFSIYSDGTVNKKITLNF
tara:strand:- start:36 stop:1019 length:984 start_codon:yes stop_codon:yes gene_type:complete